MSPPIYEKHLVGLAQQRWTTSLRSHCFIQVMKRQKALPLHYVASKPPLLSVLPTKMLVFCKAAWATRSKKYNNFTLSAGGAFKANGIETFLKRRFDCKNPTELATTLCKSRDKVYCHNGSLRGRWLLRPLWGGFTLFIYQIAIWLYQSHRLKRQGLSLTNRKKQVIETKSPLVKALK